MDYERPVPIRGELMQFEHFARAIGIQSPPHSVSPRQARPLLQRLWNASSEEEEARLLLAAPVSAGVLIAVLRDVLHQSIHGKDAPFPATSNAPHAPVFAALLAHLDRKYPGRSGGG